MYLRLWLLLHALSRYASPFDPEKLRRDRERTRKHPKLGIRLKSRRSIDAAIGTPIAPGPGTYILPSDFGQPPQIDLQVRVCCGGVVSSGRVGRASRLVAGASLHAAPVVSRSRTCTKADTDPHVIGVHKADGTQRTHSSPKREWVRDAPPTSRPHSPM